jgi:hypothetical protein
MLKELKQILKRLDAELNGNLQKKKDERHQRALNWEELERLPLVVNYPYPKSESIQPFPHQQIFDNPEKMLFNELVYAFDTSILNNSKINDDLPYTIRVNFGTVIITSLFGANVEQRENNPPWVRHFETLEEFKTVFDRDPLDFSQGICPKIISGYQFYQDVLADYPNLQRCIKLVLPDLQGPLDSLELLRGSELYTDFIIYPEMVEKGLNLMATAQVGFARHLQQFITDDKDGFSHQHGVTIKGNILIRNDSAIMISPEMYSEQVARHDEYVLNEMGGGGIHSCGRIDFNIPEIFNLESIRSFDFGQSYLNDMDMVYRLAREKKIPILRYRPSKEELLSGKVKERFPTGVSLVYEAGSLEEAVNVSNSYLKIH